MVGRQGRDEALVREEGCVDEGGEHPEEKGGLGGAVAGAGDVLVHAVDLSRGGEGLVTGAEGDGVHGAQGTQEAAETLVAVATVLCDAAGDIGMAIA